METYYLSETQEVIKKHLDQKEKEERALDSTIATLSKWQREKRYNNFRTLFQEIKEVIFEDKTISLFLAALTQSYLLRKELPERKDFREWVIEKSKKYLGQERTKSIFKTLR